MADKQQAVRFVNSEQIDFGTRSFTYLNMIAELLVKICQNRDPNCTQKIDLYLTSATWTSQIIDGQHAILEPGEYRGRIQDIFARVAVAHGIRTNAFQWSVKDIDLRNARKEPRLQLADLISNASHNGYAKLRNYPDADQTLRGFLDGFDWSFSINDILNRVDQLRVSGSYGSALITLAERAVVKDLSSESRAQFESNARLTVKEILGLPSTTRRAHLQIILGWLKKISEDRDDLTISLKRIRWIREHLCAIPESLEIDWPIDWIKMVTASYSLAACNHAGNTIEGVAFAKEIDELAKKVSGRWEYVDDLMLAFVVQAVHRNDCCEYFEASCRMESVGNFYSQINTFFQDAFPGLFPKHVKADLAGRAYGTQLQSEIACTNASEVRSEIRQDHIARGRLASERALAEFESNDDQQRQWQYRCELETAAGEYAQARKFLARSLNLEVDTHDAIASCIKVIGDKYPRGFMTLHWVRIGASAGLDSNPQELDAFVKAWNKEHFENCDWCTQWELYPSHGILRHAAVVAAVKGDQAATKRYLGRLKNVVSADKRPIFLMMKFAAQMTVLGLLERNNVSASGQNKTTIEYLVKDVRSLRSSIGSIHPRMDSVLQTWEEEMSRQAEGRLNPQVLIQLGRSMGY